MDILALHRQGHSIRWIAKKLGIHRNTVRNYIALKKQPHYRKQKRGEPILSPYHQIIRNWLEDDGYRVGWIFVKLRGHGYSGVYDTVRYFVRGINHQKAQLVLIS